MELYRVVKKSYRNKGSKDNIIISIAGAHGIGKTTIFNILKQMLNENPKFKFFPERYKKIPPFPFGSQDKQIAFRSEIHFLQQLIKRNKNITTFDNKYNGRIIILDRTPICVLIYSKSLNLKEKDYNLILDMYNSVKWKEDYIIYLTAKPEVILKRIIQRGALDKNRKYWNEDDEKYLINILSYYNEFLLSKNKTNNVYVLETDILTPIVVVNKIKDIITELSGFSFGKSDKFPHTQKKINEFLE